MEELGMPEASISPSSGSSTPSPSTAVVLCQASIIVGGPLEVSPLDSSCLGVEDEGRVAEVGDAEIDAIGVVDGFIDGDGDRGRAILDFDCGPVNIEEDGGALSYYGSDGAASGVVMVVEGVAVPSVVVLRALVKLARSSFQPMTVNHHVLVGSSLCVAGGSVTAGATTWLSGRSNFEGVVGGGMVSEEGRVLPMAREALRPQPIDGLRQPSSASVVPVSVVDSGGGQDGCSRGRSYAHVVH
ncbi:hypothetical protein Dimus_030480 [Dionaea muscipula]